jgi:hypothetical protein
MKILTTNNFLTDWMASKTYINQQGEFSEISNISDADIVKKHRMYNGELSDAINFTLKLITMNVIVFAIRQIIYQLISYSSYIPVMPILLKNTGCTTGN